MPSKKKKYNARFPPARIKKIMQSDEEVGKVAQAVPVIISRALELFVESLLKKAEIVTNARNAKTLTPSHLKQCILAERRFDFLKELVTTVPDVQGEEELAETPRSSTSNTPFIFPPPSSTATSSSISNAPTADSREPRRRSVSYINDPNLVNYHITPGTSSLYHHESAIASPQCSILNPVGANSNPYIPVQHNAATSTLPPSRPHFQYHVESNIHMTPPQNGYTESIVSLSSVSPGVSSSRTNSNAGSGVIVYDRESHQSLQDQSE